MATFKYRDKDGNNEIGAEGIITVHKEKGYVTIKADYGDMDSNCCYFVYVPNHRAEILNLIADLQQVLDNTEGWEQGYDGFYMDGDWRAECTATYDARWDKDGPGIVKGGY